MAVNQVSSITLLICQICVIPVYFWVLVAVPTYILGPNSEEQLCHYSNIEGSEICTNLTYLGKVEYTILHAPINLLSIYWL